MKEWFERREMPSGRAAEFANATAPLIAKCVELLTEKANEDFGDQWLRVYVDHRFEDFSANAGATGGVAFKDGTVEHSFTSPLGHKRIMCDIGYIRGDYQDVAWYGILFQIACDGTSRVILNYDPMCRERLMKERSDGIAF